MQLQENFGSIGHSIDTGCQVKLSSIGVAQSKGRWHYAFLRAPALQFVSGQR